MILFGLENEYTAFNKQKEHAPPNYGRFHQSRADIVLLAPSSTPGASLQMTSQGVALGNGGRLYTDLQSKVEYASPECSTLREVVCAEKAGDRIVRALYIASGYNIDAIYLMKRSAAMAMSGEKTWGAHENYLVSTELFKDVHAIENVRHTILEAHLITRLVYTGAGHIRSGPMTGSPEFWISPRANFLKERVSMATTQQRGIINTRSEPLVGNDLSKNLSRQHLICGDMNRSGWSVYLKVGTTLLVLMYLDLLSPAELTTLARAVTISDDPPLFMRAAATPFREERPRHVYAKAIDIQRTLLDAISRMEDILVDFFPETQSVLRAWALAVDGVSNLDQPSPYVTDKLDWVIKRSLIEQHIGAPLFSLGRIIDQTTRTKLTSIDFSYHRLRHGGLYETLVRKGVVVEPFPGDDIIFSSTHPPEGRSAVRVGFVRWLVERHCLGKLRDLSWERAGIAIGPHETANILFDNRSLSEVTSEAERVLRSCG